MKRPPAIGRSHKPRNPGNKPGACTVRTVATFAIRGRVVSWFACPNRTLLTPGWLLPQLRERSFHVRLLIHWEYTEPLLHLVRLVRDGVLFMALLQDFRPTDLGERTMFDGSTRDDS